MIYPHPQKGVGDFFVAEVREKKRMVVEYVLQTFPFK